MHTLQQAGNHKNEQHLNHQDNALLTKESILIMYTPRCILQQERMCNKVNNVILCNLKLGG